MKNIVTLALIKALVEILVVADDAKKADIISWANIGRKTFDSFADLSAIKLIANYLDGEKIKAEFNFTNSKLFLNQFEIDKDFEPWIKAVEIEQEIASEYNDVVNNAIIRLNAWVNDDIVYINSNDHIVYINSNDHCNNTFGVPMLDSITDYFAR